MARYLGKTFLCSCAVVAALFAIPDQASAQPLKGDWPMMNFDAAGLRNNPYETILTKKSVPSLHLAWKLALNPKASITGSSPAVAGGVLYVGSNDGNFYARDAVTGKKRWTVKLNSTGLSAAPAIANDVVYIPDSNTLRALDAATGSTLWSTTFESGTLGSSVVSHGLVFQDWGNAQLSALNARSGKTMWTSDILGGNVSSGAPAVADDVVYAYSGPYLSAYTASTGTLLWRADAIEQPSMESSPAVTNGTVYYGTDGDVVAHSAATGTLAWRTQSGPNLFESIAVAHNHVYTLDTAGNIWNYDGNTGVPTLMQGQIGQISSPTIANGVLYATASPGGNSNVSAYDLKTGALLWSAPLAAMAQTSPVVSNGMLYVVAGSLYAFALKQ